MLVSARKEQVTPEGSDFPSPESSLADAGSDSQIWIAVYQDLCTIHAHVHTMRAVVLKRSFGEAISDDDTIEIQGTEYHLRPMGVKVMRQMWTVRQQADDPEANLNAAVEVLKASVVEAEHDRLMKQIEETMSLGLLTEIALWLMNGQADVDPTLLALSAAGSSATGSSSTAGAPPAASIPSS